MPNMFGGDQMDENYAPHLYKDNIFIGSNKTKETIMTNPKKSYDELWLEIKPYAHYQNKIVKHVKTDNLYKIRGFHFKESDMTLWFTYSPINHGHIKFSRPIEEFLDGRFMIL